MNVKDIMQTPVMAVSAATNLRNAAQLMRDEGIGFLVVAENDELIGTLTDRDIVTRAVSQGLDMNSVQVDEIMSINLLYCHEEHSVDEVANQMNETQVRRIPVVGRDNKLTGIVSIGDMAQHLSPEMTGHVLKGITESYHSHYA